MTTLDAVRCLHSCGARFKHAGLPTVPDLSRNDLYARLQSRFVPKLVVIVGSGASAADGLPTMTQLADHLRAQMPRRLAALTDAASEAAWTLISSALDDHGLEGALGTTELPALLDQLISDEVGDCVLRAEQVALSRILLQKTLTPMARLLRYAQSNNPVLDVITTNYDRLIEAGAARAELRVDTMFTGGFASRLDARASEDEHLRPRQMPGRSARITLTHHPRVRLAKPHGSLDWFESGGEVLRSEHQLAGSRRIVAPGGSKYRKGYDLPFDAHRTRATSAIDQASAFLTVGYGFNDDHLQTHLPRQFEQVPATILSRSLTEPAKRFLELNAASIGIERIDDQRSLVYLDGATMEVEERLWDLDVFLREVLNE